MSFIIDCGAWFVHYRWGALWKLLKVNLFTRLSINISAWYDTWLIESVAKAGAWLNCDGLIAPESMPRLDWRLFSVDASLASYSRIFTKWLHIVFRRAHVSCLSPNNAPINDHWTRPEKKKTKKRLTFVTSGYQTWSVICRLLIVAHVGRSVTDVNLPFPITRMQCAVDANDPPAPFIIFLYSVSNYVGLVLYFLLLIGLHVNRDR